MEINFPLTNKNVILIEDHHEALSIWRQKDFKGLDLVHIDAHIDFAFHLAMPIEKIFNKARNLKELKKNLEYTLAFGHYEKDLDKQTNIGNYIYPAMEEGIVKDFYWVIQGRIKEFKQSLKIIKGILKKFSRQEHCQSYCTLKDGIISAQLLGRKFVCPTFIQDLPQFPKPFC